MYYSLKSPYMYTIYFYLIDSTISHQHPLSRPTSLSPSQLQVSFLLLSSISPSPVCVGHMLMDVGLSNGSWVASQPVVTSPEKKDPSFSSHQPPIALLLGEMLWELLSPFWIFDGLDLVLLLYRL